MISSFGDAVLKAWSDSPFGWSCAVGCGLVAFFLGGTEISRLATIAGGLAGLLIDEIADRRRQ